MKITRKKRKGITTITFCATSRDDKDTLTKAVMSGSLMDALNGKLPVVTK